MLRSIQLDFNDDQGNLMMCQNCQRDLIQLNKAEYFVKVEHSSKEIMYYYAARLQEKGKINHPFSVDWFSLYTEVEQPFCLMQLAKVECRNCKVQIGIYVNSASQEDTKWLQHHILFNEHCITLKSKEQQYNLRKMLLQQMSRNEKEEQAENSTKQLQKDAEEKSTPKVDELLQGILQNIIFYSQLYDDINNRKQEEIALHRYENVKIRSSRKESSRKYSN